MKPRYSIGENEMAYAFGLTAAKLAAETLWEEGATGLNRHPLWVYNAKGEPVGYYAGGSWSGFNRPQALTKVGKRGLNRSAHGHRGGDGRRMGRPPSPRSTKEDSHMVKQEPALDLTAEQREAAEAQRERERDMTQLATLIDEAGELNTTKSDAERAYGEKRRQIEALMDRLNIARHEGETYRASRATRREKFIDPDKLLKTVAKKRALACMAVIYKRAEGELTSKQLGQLTDFRDGAVVLTIKHKGDDARSG